MPENRRLVPEAVFRLGWFLGPLQFGIEMGTGFRTFVTTSIPYMLVLALFMFPGWGHVFAASFGFALGRTLMATLSIGSGNVTAWAEAFSQSKVLRWALLAIAMGFALSTYSI